MIPSHELTCGAARERLSARLDGELSDARGLAAHLARCGACRAHERTLGALTGALRALAAADAPAREPTHDLWPRIEARARRRQALLPLARVAAALVGFVGLGAAALLVERGSGGSAPGKHLLERLALEPEPHTLFSDLPEYRLLRALPGAPGQAEESR